jgi:S1-C subfamily serine protease
MSIAPNVGVAKTENVSELPHRGPRLGSRILLSAGAALVIVAGVVIMMGRLARSSGHPLNSSGSTATSVTPPAPVKLSPGEIAAKYSDAVVVLENYNEQGQKAAQGSGFIFSPEGKVLTNYHVIRGASRMVARMHDQSTHEVEYMAGFDMQHDVAVIKIEGIGLPSVHLGNSSLVKSGDHVTALGAPLGLDSTLSDGIISAVWGFRGKMNAIPG